MKGVFFFFGSLQNGDRISVTISTAKIFWLTSPHPTHSLVTSWYSTICGSGYQPEFQNFEPKDYVCLQQIVLITLDVTNNYVF